MGEVAAVHDAAHEPHAAAESAHLVVLAQDAQDGVLVGLHVAPQEAHELVELLVGLGELPPLELGDEMLACDMLQLLPRLVEVAGGACSARLHALLGRVQGVELGNAAVHDGVVELDEDRHVLVHHVEEALLGVARDAVGKIELEAQELHALLRRVCAALVDPDLLGRSNTGQIRLEQSEDEGDLRFHPVVSDHGFTLGIRERFGVMFLPSKFV